MICKKCRQAFNESEMDGKDKRFCRKCFERNSEFIKGRKVALNGLRGLQLEGKIIKSLDIIDEAVREFGQEKIYISYSGGKDSTVLSHLVRIKYPNMLHIFAETTNEYPETLQHLKWEQQFNEMNLLRARPRDKYKKPWNFRRVVDEYGYPLFTKSVANAIRTYRRAKTKKTKQNVLDYIQRNFKKYEQFKDCNISDKCCDRLKKDPIKKMAKKLKLECVILGILAEESRQRELDWIMNGCNVFYKQKDNQCRPLAFWTEADIYEYINIYNVRIPKLYEMGYDRNGCMFCGFGVTYENEPNRFQRLAKTHPKSYAYLIKNFEDIFEECGIKYKTD